MSTARHELLEHTGEVQLRIHAASLPELFVEAGLALARIMAGDEGLFWDSTDERDVVIEARDLSGLLVDWLNELIFHSETRKVVYSVVHVASVTERELHAHIRGAAPRALKTAVKAATWHDVSVDARDGGYVATVTLDV